VLIGIILCGAVIVLWLLYFPSSTPQGRSEVGPLIIDPVARPAAATVPTPSPAPSPAPSPVADQKVSSDALVRGAVTGGPAPVATPVPTVAAPRAPAGIVYVPHAVKDGETLDSIAAQYSLDKETIISVNAIKSLSAVKGGEVLSIPDRNGQIYTVQSGDSLSIITNRYNPTLGWKTLQELNGLSSEVIHPGQKLFIPSASVEADGSFASFNRFVKPAVGRITGLYGQMVKYGNSEEIVKLQGIWIEGVAGSTVQASGSGVVVDVGNDPASLGRFAVISHADGYRTKYGHLDTLTVKVGDQVRQGDPIGTLGSTGSIGKTTLFFSLEQEGTALNPADFF
jgi:murein DD-endopeptidase MepM/ murein hydrolase activator NlpD